MNMFARFDENPAMTLRVIKETKRYGRTDGRTDGRENSIPPTNKVCGGYKKRLSLNADVKSIAECSKGEHSAILSTFIKLPGTICL